MPDQRFLRKYRIRRGSEFERVFARRCAAADERMVVHGCENGLDHPRIGLAVSRRVGNAVVRSRVRRLLRESFRLARARLPAGVDLVVVPRGRDDYRLAELMRSLEGVSRRVARKLSQSRPLD